MSAPEAGTWHKARYGRLAHLVHRVNVPNPSLADTEVTTVCNQWRIVHNAVAGQDVERCKACERAAS